VARKQNSKNTLKDSQKLAQEIDLLETETRILKEGIDAINQILKNKIPLNPQEIDEITFLLYAEPDENSLDIGIFCEIGRLFLKHRELFLDDIKGDSIFKLIHLLIVLEELSHPPLTEKQLLALKSRAKKYLSKIEKKKKKLLERYAENFKIWFYSTNEESQP
jgi:hypothetical protein